MTRAFIPDEILALAHERARAREARDWAEADRLRAAIETAGWRIVDRGTDFALTPAAPPDLVEGEHVRYGASRNVPSRLDEAAEGLATVILIATDWPDDLERALAGLRSVAGGDVGRHRRRRAVTRRRPQALEALAEAAEPGPTPEIVWTSERLGHAAALNVGIRRASGPVVVVLDTSVEPQGDIVTPLVDALGDPTVAVAGPWGLVSSDMRKFEDAPPGDVDAIGGYALAFRRADYVERGPLDERFRFYRNLDIWWSLVLRDEGEGEPAAPGRQRRRVCRSRATSTAAGRACPTRSATASRSGTSTGSSIGSGRGAIC